MHLNLARNRREYSRRKYRQCRRLAEYTRLTEASCLARLSPPLPFPHRRLTLPAQTPPFLYPSHPLWRTSSIFPFVHMYALFLYLLHSYQYSLRLLQRVKQYRRLVIFYRDAHVLEILKHAIRVVCSPHNGYVALLVLDNMRYRDLHLGDIFFSELELLRSMSMGMLYI